MQQCVSILTIIKNDFKWVLDYKKGNINVKTVEMRMDNYFPI